ncbi:homeobox-leucine zipper protein ROC5-like [Elaeis guineensis]|uniref:Homeobox-leucine zipper protein ROC5-like n=1 Tax=Elaeis guineensis var. tenera TaxID=51953 RepID=A0A6J0PPQ3_ELAGV|nr:homeobox-leucine zipper protein ROC5-like [Elaeis guineensis]
MFTLLALSLTLETNMKGQDEMSQLGVIGGVGDGSGDKDSMSRNREDENTNNLETNSLKEISINDLDQENPRKKKRYHRHTAQQIQELETLFKEYPHPNEKQRLELSKQLCLDTRQVKFWFQNRRTQLKTQIEHHENSILRQENEKLKSENMTIRDAMINPCCNSCGGPTILGEVSLEEKNLRIENARLKDEINRVYSLAKKFLGRAMSSLDNPISPIMPNSALELVIGNNSFNGFDMISTLPTMLDFVPRASNPMVSITTSSTRNYGILGGADKSNKRSILLELALAAMEELVKMAQLEDPLWIPNLEGGKEMLNYNEYYQVFPRIIGVKPIGYVSEATRESEVVIINSQVLVETLMDATRWADMFPTLIARSATIDTICSGMDGSKNGALQLMHAELQVLSPLVPIHSIDFLRYCKQQAENVWAVVDVSIDCGNNYPPSAGTYMSCRRLPSGCIVQNMSNGYSKITWVEHTEYDESGVHPLYRPLLRSGLALGARSWVSSLRRRCECIANLISSFTTDEHSAALSGGGKRSMLRLARRMTDSFCAGVCAWATHGWRELTAGSFGEDVRVMTRKSVNNPGEPQGVVLSAATSVLVPVPPQRLFDFLRDERRRGEWDILSNGGPMQEVLRVAKGHHAAIAVSLLRPSVVGASETSMLILQDTCTDASVSLVVYAPVDVSAMHVVMNGGDPAYVAFLPSGFAILPDGSGGRATTVKSRAGELAESPAGGSLLTVAFQILVSSNLNDNPKDESVKTVSNLMSCTIQNIKTAVQCEN